jgi:hypothetical protein
MLFLGFKFGFIFNIKPELSLGLTLNLNKSLYACISIMGATLQLYLSPEESSGQYE